MTSLKTIITALLTLTLAACGGDSRNEGGPGPGASVTVTPSLGKVTSATLRVLSFQGTLLAQGFIGSSGSVVVKLPPGQEGFIVELQGGPGAAYFDEGMGMMRPLPAGHRLHAISGGARTAITVTAFTEIVYQRVRALAGNGVITPALVAQAEAELAAAFSTAAGSSYLDIPSLLDDPLDLPNESSWAGQYAGWLAALAQHAYSQSLTTQPACITAASCAPLLELIDDLAADFADGAIDGRRLGDPVNSAFYAGNGMAAKDDLLQKLAQAAQTFRSRVSAQADGFPSTDRSIGQRFAGSYALTCAAAATANQPAQLTISADGSFAANGTFGRLLLAAGTTQGRMLEAGIDSAIGRTGTFQSSTATAVTDRPVADGLSGFDPDFNPVITPPGETRSITFLGDGNGEVRVGEGTWHCSGFPTFAEGSSVPDARLRAWLPDGNYRCEQGTSYSSLIEVSVAEGIVQLGGATLALSQPVEATETQGEISPSVISESVDHFHLGDAVAQTTAPLAQLVAQFTQNDASYALHVRHSLATGKGYFDIASASLSLRHCLRVTDLPPPPPPTNCSGASRFC